jgi:hypothetical protein
LIFARSTCSRRPLPWVATETQVVEEHAFGVAAVVFSLLASDRSELLVDALEGTLTPQGVAPRLVGLAHDEASTRFA